MLNSTTEKFLSPLLIAQGIYVKKSMIRLPEPEGDRSGVIGEGTSLKLLITGDSAAAGVGTDTQTNALSGQLIQLLKKDYQCEWALHAKTGFTISTLFKYLKIIPAQEFDIVLVSIGVNDVTSTISVQEWTQKIRKLHQLLKEKFSAKFIVYTELPPIDKFPAIPNPLSYFLGKTAKNMNTELNNLFKNKSDSTLLCFDLPYGDEFIATDGFHPSSTAYKIWAEYAHKAIHERMV